MQQPPVSDNHTFISLLRQHFPEAAIAAIEGGASGAKLFCIERPAGPACIAKLMIKKNGTESLRKEKTVYDWLRGRMPVPQVILYHETAVYELLCMSEVAGIPLSSPGFAPAEIVPIYANTLRRLHALPADGHCPHSPPDEAIAAAVFRVQQGLVDTDDLEDEYAGQTATALLQQLLLLRPADEELVFTHGDYCPDNLFIHNGALSGIIDAGRAGIACRYRDIALALRSIRHYWGSSWIPLFLETYGLTKPDEKKSAFYTLLDEFF